MEKTDVYQIAVLSKIKSIVHIYLKIEKKICDVCIKDIILFLEQNVYLVDGAKNAAFYDLSKGKLYQLSEDAKILIHKSLENQKNDFNSSEIAFLNELCQKELLTENYVESHCISDLIEKKKIEFVWIEITNCCNLKCVHCYNEADSKCEKVMAFEAFKHIINELVRFGIRKIQIIGGEPFILGEKLFEYLEYCKNKFDLIEIFTNGTLIKAEWFSYLKKNNIHIALSVYSYIEKEHNKVTQISTSWAKTNDSIRKLEREGIPYRVKNVIMNNIKIGRHTNEPYILSYKKDIVRLTGRAQINLLSTELIKRKLIVKNNLARKITKEFVKKCISGHNCFSSRLYFSVDLDVYPCVMERRISHGNIRNQKLSSIIKKNIVNFNKDYIKECKDCEFRYCCFDCRPDSNGKKIYEKPWFCTYKPLEGLWENDLTSFINNLKDNKI